MLQDKTVFISGGTGFLGEAICRKSAAYGAKVIFSYNKNKEKAELLEKELNNARSIQLNIENIGDINKKISNLYNEVPAIDILINNTGITRPMPLSMLEEADIDQVLNINIKGNILLTRAIVKGMIRNKKGSIINMGSIAGQRILDVPITYATSKAAMTGFTTSLAAELKNFNIRVNCIIPGMLEGGVASLVPAELKNDFISHCLTKRAGSAEEVAEVVCFAASDKASYVNGQNICVDGGI